MTDWPVRGLDLDAVDGEAEGRCAHAQASSVTGSRPWTSTASRKASCKRDARRERRRREPRLVEFGEVAHGGQDRVRRRLAEPAAAHPRDGVGQGFGRCDVREGGAAGDDLLHPLLEQRGADPAGRAPAAGFVDEEIGELQRDVEHVAPGPKTIVDPPVDRSS